MAGHTGGEAPATVLNSIMEVTARLGDKHRIAA
jgi:hypothetical protein